MNSAAGLLALLALLALLGMLGLGAASAGAQSYAFPFTAHLRNEFNRTFHDRCSKYSFVRDYARRLERPSAEDKFVVFVFQDTRLNNGGLGDRLAGLLSAMNFALRFNRTLLVRSKTGIGRLFGPYHPLAAERERFSYEAWSDWTSYQAAWADHDETEYDLWMCINNVGSGSGRCSMEKGDVSQPVILYRSNRAYLCRDHLHTELPSHDDLLRTMGGGRDLFELAGCMLRMAFWPTELLWQKVDELYAQQTAAAVSAAATTAPPRPQRDRQRHQLRRRRLSGHEMTDVGVGAGPFFQVGMHFRCGDRSYLNGASYNAFCVFNGSWSAYHKDEQEALGRFNIAMEEGTPWDLGACAARVAQNHSALLVAKHVAFAHELPSTLSQTSHGAAPVAAQWMVTLAASDNAQSADQMTTEAHQRSAHWAAGLLTPAGCHIQLQETFECQAITVATWFMLAQSDALVMQTIPNMPYPVPTSAFSRYAGVYGLRKDPFRDARSCDEVPTTRVMSEKQQGNWFC